MKKIFFFATSLLVAGSMMANVAIDLSEGQSVAEEGVTSTVSFAQSVCTATITSPAAWTAGGVEFMLSEPIKASDITSITGSIKCDETSEYMELTVFVRDTNENRWHSGTALAPVEMSDWTAINEVPAVSYWDEQQASDYPNQIITSVAVFLSPGAVISQYKVSVKDLVINVKTAALPVVNAEGKATKAMVNGQLVIMRNGEVFNALGAAL